MRIIRSENIFFLVEGTQPFCTQSINLPNSYINCSDSPTYCSQTMSRSAIDATRFTATSPHAYSKPFAIRSSSASASSSHPLPPSFISPLSRKNAPPSQKLPNTPSSSSPQKSAETPAQKVARLRAARFAAKYAEAPLWDRIVIRGRYVADKAHRITVYSLMGLTGMFSFHLNSPPPENSTNYHI